MKNLPKEPQSGQALLIVLLSLTVVLTIGLSVISRSITDVSLTGKEEESLRAFSAAEAGVERALITGANVGQTAIGNASFTSTITGALGGPQVVFPDPLQIGESALVWFVNHSDTGALICDGTHSCFTGNTMKVCWGKQGTSASSATTPAIEVSVYYTSIPGDYSTTKIARAVYDPNTTRQPPNFFATPGGVCTIGTENFAFSQTITFFSTPPAPPATFDPAILCANIVNCLQYAKISILYNSDTSHKVGVDVTGVGVLPPQAIKVESSGSSGGANRKVELIQDFGAPPPIFDGVFSPSGLVK